MTTPDAHVPIAGSTGPAYLITVITVCRNAEQTIGATLESVAAQVGVAGLVEHVVVDGASQDGTLDVVRRYPAVRWLSEPDEGISDAFNKGARLATGLYLLYLNADDYLADESVMADVVRFIQKEDQPDWVVGDVVAALHGEISFHGRRYAPSCWSLMFRNRIHHQAMFLKRDIQLAVGGFEERFKTSMDYDLFERLCARGIRPTYYPRVISVFSEHGLTSVRTPTLIAETQEVAGRFRDNPAKRLIGHVYDRRKGLV